ncbi:hypothetical protein ABZ897_18765 [Nonomuraea sp. NPDC046802]|uniref:hypothetical protein n=1 Tax=Nonomuraea sp. NPDC046802 TaxID=3154919 RepID=UPI0033D780CB
MSRTVLAAVGTAVLIAVAVLAVRMATSQSADGPRSTPVAPTAHRAETPAPGEDYWTDERMRQASPAPAPVHTE